MKTYAILNSSDLTQEKFVELKAQGIGQTSLETCRRSVDGTKVLIKWSGETAPAALSSLTVSFQGSHSETRNELSKPEWVPTSEI